MSRQKHYFLLSLMLLVCIPATLAFAGRDLDQDEVLERVRSGEIRPLFELIALNPGRFNGKLLDVEVEYDDDRLIYEIEILGTDGVVREFELDPVTGRVLKEEIED